MATPAAEPVAATAAAPLLPDGRSLAGELRAAPGRLEFALRLALVCTLSAGISEWFQTPETALSAYIGFFLLRADRTTSTVLGLGMLLLASLLIALVAWMSNGLIGRPAALLATMALMAFALFFLGSASKLAPVAGILALITTFALSLIGRVPEGELATRALLYGWLLVAIPVGVSTAVNLLAGPAPRRLAQQALARRLAAAAGLLRGAAGARAEMQRLRLEGVGGIRGWLRLAALEHSSPPQDIAALNRACDDTTRVLLLVELLDAHSVDTGTRAGVAQVLEGMAQILAQGGYPVEIALPPLEGAGLDARAAQALAALRATLESFALGDSAAPDTGPDAGFFASDAWSSPRHLRFALKATGAAMFCYLFYNALDWQGIHTAFITCFIVALGTAGETVQKLRLRIAGCLVGAALGVAALLWVLPHVEGLAGLLALLFTVTLLATWVAAGSPRIAYAGFQIAFAFYLCVLQGNGPSYDLGVAADRVIGILIGNAVVYLVFTRVWPVSVAQRIDAGLARLLRRASAMAAATLPRQAAAQAGAAEAERARIAADMELLAYEPPSVRPDTDWAGQRRDTLQCATALLAPLALRPGEPAVAQRLEALAQQLAGAMAPPSAAPAAVSEWLAPPLRQLSAAVQRQAVHPPTSHDAR